MPARSVAAAAAAAALFLGAVLLAASRGGWDLKAAQSALRRLGNEEGGDGAGAAAVPVVAEAAPTAASPPAAAASLRGAGTEEGPSSEMTPPDFYIEGIGAPIAGEDFNDTSSESHGDCLCIFDIDRTLTGKQGVAGNTCPGNRVMRGVWDDAYGGGDLTLSRLAVSGVRSTACRACKIGIVSHGTAGGNTMKGIIRNLINPPSSRWSYPGNVHSPLVLGCGYKPPCVRDVMKWYNRHGANISPNNVYLFDDKRGNIDAMRGSGMNAHRISCHRLSGEIGLCGAEPHEIRLQRGVSSC